MFVLVGFRTTKENGEQEEIQEPIMTCQSEEPLHIYRQVAFQGSRYFHMEIVDVPEIDTITIVEEK